MLPVEGAEPRPVVMRGALEPPSDGLSTRGALGREVEMLGCCAGARSSPMLLAPPPTRGPFGLTVRICPLLTLASKPWSPRRNEPPLSIAADPLPAPPLCPLEALGASALLVAAL